jgi:hypothetical protein
MDVSGVWLDAFSTNVFPVVMQRGIIHPNGIMAGKLKGTMPAKSF